MTEEDESNPPGGCRFEILPRLLGSDERTAGGPRQDARELSLSEIITRWLMQPDGGPPVLSRGNGVAIVATDPSGTPPPTSIRPRVREGSYHPS